LVVAAFLRNPPTPLAYWLLFLHSLCRSAIFLLYSPIEQRPLRVCAKSMPLERCLDIREVSKTWTANQWPRTLNPDINVRHPNKFIKPSTSSASPPLLPAFSSGTLNITVVFLRTPKSAIATNKYSGSPLLSMRRANYLIDFQT
jgi:hypothetical protein